jgi:DNA-binding CsgD family transcriptional regulator
MIHPASEMPACHRVQYSYSQTGHYPQGRIQSLMVRIADSKESVLLLNSSKDGGPAIIAWGVQNQMLLYRDDLSLKYTEEDAALAGALWRACGTELAVPASEPGARPLIEELEFPPRIRQVLAFMLDGLLEKEIAAQLSISPHTVHVHVKHLYRRMGVNSRSQLMSHCYTRGVTSALLHESVQNQFHLLSARVNMKVECRQIEPADQIVPPSRPVTAVPRSRPNMRLS